MTITFRLDREDLAALHRVVQRQLNEIAKAKSQMFFFNIALWVPIGIFLAASASFYRQNPCLSGDLNVIIGSFVVGIVALLAGSAYWRRRLKWSLLASDSWFYNQQELITHPDHLVVKAAYGDTSYKWSAFRRLLQDDKRLFLFIDNAQALIVPKTAFITQEQLDEFKSYIRSEERSNNAPNSD